MQENSWDGSQMFMATSTLVFSHVFCAYKKCLQEKNLAKLFSKYAVLYSVQNKNT